tara:strand:+ start:99 stop:1151 length:1053 start_codon:yes stop_codon:yes gene_type:complete
MKLLDLFSGIGGFHLGLEQAGFKFDWVGFSEIDKYASEQYKKRFPKAKELGDVTTIQPKRLPNDITILCGGFPCQAFSIAGKRAGFNDTRGTLFFEIARILRYFKGIGKPIPYFICENVKGLLNHDNGRTFATIYGVLANLDYTIECQLLNTRWFLPQNRERIYIVGHLGKRSRSKIFPIRETGEVLDKRATTEQVAATLQSPGNACGNYKGMNMIKIADYRNDEGVRIRDGGDAPCLTASHHSENEPSRMQGLVIKPVLTPNRPEKRQNGRRFKDDGEDMFTLTSQDQHGVMEGSNIRRLTPTECERLQGFPDAWTEGQSDTQRYKQLGNAVSVPVVKAVGERIFENMH